MSLLEYFLRIVLTGFNTPQYLYVSGHINRVNSLELFNPYLKPLFSFT
jgi:hypothetical protein